MGFGLVLIGGIVLLTLFKTPSLSEQVSDISNNSTLLNSEIPRISVRDAKAAYDLRSAIFVDVRGDESYKDGHIPSALSIPENLLLKHMSGINYSDWIITYCTWPAEESSARAAATMRANGFTNVTALKGGYYAWLEAGYPIEKE